MNKIYLLILSAFCVAVTACVDDWDTGYYSGGPAGYTGSGMSRPQSSSSYSSGSPARPAPAPKGSVTGSSMNPPHPTPNDRGRYVPPPPPPPPVPRDSGYSSDSTTAPASGDVNSGYSSSR